MEDLATAAIEHAAKLGAEFADIRLEQSSGVSLVVMDGKTRTLAAQKDEGCGIRAFMGGMWGFASSDGLSKSSVKAAASEAVKMARAARSKVKVEFKIRPEKPVRLAEEYRCREPVSEVPMEDKLEYVMSLDGSMRTFDPRITSTNSRYDDLEVQRVVSNTFGTQVRTLERWVLASCSAYAKAEGVIQRGHAPLGNVGGFELVRGEAAHSLGVEAASMAIRLLDTKPAPAGMFTCVLDNKMTGLLAHEAFGHACEADGVLAGASVLEDKVDKQVAVEAVNMYDDPTVKNTFGYYSVDWEGVKSKRHVLVERGILKGFLHNLETGSRMGITPSGSARSQAYSSPPIIRMSNTYFGPGDCKKDELIEEVKAGLLIKGSQYGYVEPAKGQFMFKCDEAYQIKDGELGQRYRDASISGIILDVLNNVQGMADDFTLTDPGYCGKGGQIARTTDGGPHMCVKDMVVGGLT